MSQVLQQRIFGELEQLVLIDPHSHINPHSAASQNLGEIMGYHYYTELCHSAGLIREQIEEPGISPKEKVSRLVPFLPTIENTVQYGWLIDMCQSLLGFKDETITQNNWENLYDSSLKLMQQSDWEDQVLKNSKLEAVFLTNDFDDPLAGFDTSKYIPCLRTDDLVFHLTNPQVRARLHKATLIDVKDASTLRNAIGHLFAHFIKHKVKACAISLPPFFAPTPVSDAELSAVLNVVVMNQTPTSDQITTLQKGVFWMLAEHCQEYKLPFDLMIGVNRRVYEAGVYQGMDLFDMRVSLIQYGKLFNAFPGVIFPISVLAQSSNHELVSYSWIFPNVVCNGHWWYSNIPNYIEQDCRARLEALPGTKNIGYYSDMYKLEFGMPKFKMYRRILSKVLAEQFVMTQGWSEERAIVLGKKVLRGNVERIFFGRD